MMAADSSACDSNVSDSSPRDSSKGMSVAVLGATGLVGRHCLSGLLRDVRVTHLKVISRTLPLWLKTVSESHLDRLDVMEGALDEVADFTDIDTVICCLGTTLKKAGSVQGFIEVDLSLITRMASRAQQQGVKRLIIISAVNANADSKLLYSRVKGQLEAELKTLGFGALLIIKPSLLIGERAERRWAEQLSAPLMHCVSPLLKGRWARYRAVSGDQVSRCILAQLNTDPVAAESVSDEPSKTGRPLSVHEVYVGEWLTQPVSES